MPDVNNPYAAGFFFANEPGVNLKMREKIALAQMMQKHAAPKNIGEGIYSIGDSISDAIMARQLMQQDKDAQLAASKLGAPADPGAITPLASGGPPLAQAAGGQDPTSQAPIQPSVQEGGPPTAPGPMFRPNLRTETVMPPADPAVPAPPDVPGAIRMSTPAQLADFKRQNPLPRGMPPVPQVGPMPPPGAPPPGEPPPAAPPPARPSVADFGQKLALAPTPPPAPGATPPVVAQGPDPASSEDPRRSIALTMLKQQMGGQGGPPRSAPAPAPVPPPAVPDQSIRPAPPPTQMTQGQPAPVPGYVPPEVVNPTGAKIIQPSRREMELTAVLQANQGNPYAPQSPAANELQRLVKERELRQTEQNELFKADISRGNTQGELRQRALMDQPERVLRVKEMERKLAKPDLEDISDKFERDPVTGKWRQPQMETPQDPNAMPQVKMSKEQADNLTFYGWAGNATKNMQGKDQMLAHGLQQELLGKVPVFGNQLQTAEYRRARNAANSFVLAFMRDTSGAAYGAKEMYDHASAFLPKQGDDPQTLADKSAARERFVQGKYAGLGSGGQRVAQWQDQQDAAKEQTAAVKSITEVGRPGDRIGETVTSKKTGKQRVWDGKQWHDL